MGEENRWDLHSHSGYSWDVVAGHDAAAMCAAALAAGLRGLAVTDHFDSVPQADVANRRRTGVFDITSLLADIAAAREAYPGLTVLAGLEYGEPQLNPGQIRALREEHSLDVILGSVHAIVVGNELLPVEDVLAREPVDAVMRCYLQQLLAMVEDSPIDVLAHLEYPLRYPSADGYRPEQHEDLYSQIVKTAARRGISVEYNTKSAPLLFDHIWPIIDGVAETTITIGADAHITEHIGRGVGEALTLLSERGFGACRQLSGRLCRRDHCRNAPPHW
jgi:histidinol-phosphatase (PHP family)